MTIFDKVFDSIAWIRIFLSPFLIGVAGGVGFWFTGQQLWYKIISVLFFLAGIVLGIFLAERARKRMGTQNFMSRVNEFTTGQNKDN